MKLFARAKHFRAMPLSQAEFRVLLEALKNGDPERARRTGNFDMVDFSGTEVDLGKLTQAAEKLETRVTRDVGRDNYHVDVPPWIANRRRSSATLSRVSESGSGRMLI